MSFFRFAAATLLILAAIPVRAQESGVAYLRVGPNAAAVALGDAHVALSADVFSTHWNPAGLAADRSQSIAATHHLWAGDMRGFALAARLNQGEHGGFGLFGTGFVNEAFGTPGESAETANDLFFTLGASYGRSLGPLRAGLTLKFLSEGTGEFRTQGFAGDLGLQADVLRGALRLGAALRNVGRIEQIALEPRSLPSTLSLGAAVFPFQIMAEEDGTRLLNVFATGEVSQSLTSIELAGREETQFHMGVAAEILEVVVARAGYVTGDDVRGISAGVGLRYQSLQVDHAFVPFQQGFGAGHVLTLMYRW